VIAAAELARLAQDRASDAHALRSAGRYDGAVYLAGYAVELALKARICTTLGWPSFPETPGEFKGLASFRTHDLDLLLRLSGVEGRILSDASDDWEIVRAWRPELRYSTRRATNAESVRFEQAVALLMSVL
jgi:HEPN domain-containing protein